MGIYFNSEVIFVNAYYGLGNISVRNLGAGESYLGITIKSGDAVLVSTPFYKSDDSYHILREYINILIKNVEKLFETSGNVNFDPMYNKYDFREEYDFTGLVTRYGKKPITKEIVDRANSVYKNYPDIIKALEESSVILRKKLNCYN